MGGLINGTSRSTSRMSGRLLSVALWIFYEYLRRRYLGSTNYAARLSSVLVPGRLAPCDLE
jgi:hypothetical protein